MSQNGKPPLEERMNLSDYDLTFPRVGLRGMVYRFDDFVFDPDAAGLVKAGRAVALEPQVVSLLKHLIENRGRIVSKDELIAEIWDGRAISDAALNTRIRAVRRALGDDRTQQKFLRTYPKRGFQFVADVESVEPAHDVEKPVAVSRVNNLRRSWGLSKAAVVLLVVVVVGAVWVVEETGLIKASAPPPAKPSIAVMPFDNLSGNADHGYLADAFTEDLITDLSRIRDAFLIARRTSFTYKGKSVDVKEVAAELGVRYILEGSVRRSGNRLRINAQLIDGLTGRHVWSDRYDRVLTDIFEVQADVTGQIAAVLKAELREADSKRHVPPENLEAWDYSLRGNVLLFNPDGAEDFQKAKALLDKAVELDPDIASAWSGLAFIHFVASLRPIPGISSPNSKDLSLKTAQKAVSLDPKNAEGHWMIGVGYARNGLPEQGLASCRTAMDINPNNDCAYVCAGLTNMALGKPIEALPHFRHSLRLNPGFRPFTKYKYMGLAHLHGGEDQEAIDALNRAIAGAPKDPMANFALASALALTGRVADARATLEKAMRLAYEDRITIETLRANYSWLGPGFERVLDGLRLAGMPDHHA